MILAEKSYSYSEFIGNEKYKRFKDQNKNQLQLCVNHKSTKAYEAYK